MISGKNYIGSKVSANGERTFHTFDPKSNQNTAWAFYEASSTEIDEAVHLAEQAFQEYKQFSGVKKAGFLRKPAFLLNVGA